MNEIVKYHNDMASVSFPNFTPTQHNIFTAICYECKDKGSAKHAIPISKLKELAGYESKDEARFIAYLDDLSTKLFTLEYKENKSDGGFKKFVLFTYFETDKLRTDDAALLVGVSEEFSYILNNDTGKFPMLMSGYTTFELQQHNELKSVYSKQCFKQLKRFKRTGWWYVTIEEFRRLLDVPENYRMTEINKRVLKPIKEELPKYFKDLCIEEEKGGASGRKVVALRFTFKPQVEKSTWNERDVFETIYNCRYCSRPIYAIFKKSTGEMFYGHEDGWKKDAICRRTYSSLDEVLENYENSDNDSKYERAGFSCRKCGRPLYILKKKNGEIFYGHPDGLKEGAVCSATYGSIAEIRGYSETPGRSEHDAYYLVEKGSEEEAYGYYETERNE